MSRENFYLPFMLSFSLMSSKTYSLDFPSSPSAAKVIRFFLRCSISSSSSSYWGKTLLIYAAPSIPLYFDAPCVACYSFFFWSIFYLNELCSSMFSRIYDSSSSTRSWPIITGVSLNVIMYSWPTHRQESLVRSLTRH